jgi:transposase
MLYNFFIMTYGYSDDLRIAALSYYDKEDVTQKQVSNIFGISLKTFSNWIRLRKSGDFSRRPSGTKRPSIRLDESSLVEYISDNPDSYLHEVAQYFSVHPTTIYYALKRLGITRKKNRTVSGA